MKIFFSMAGEPPLHRVGPLVHKALCCLRCGGFTAYRPPGAEGPIGYGRAVSRLMNLEPADVVGYYSRTLEEFGGSKLVRYLLRDSLACTLAQKHKLSTRAAAYRKLGATLLGFPLPSSQRPRRFRSEQAAPTWPCSYTSGCPLGHGDQVAEMFETLREAEAHDKAAWRAADARVGEGRAAIRQRSPPGWALAAGTSSSIDLSLLRQLLDRRRELREARRFVERAPRVRDTSMTCPRHGPRRASSRRATRSAPTWASAACTSTTATTAGTPPTAGTARSSPSAWSLGESSGGPTAD